MKRLLFILIAIAVLAQTRAQQVPQYTHYIFNYFALNPAFAGSGDCLDVRLGFRSQWVGFEGAPRTAFANFHTPLKLKKSKNVYTKHGVGLHVHSDNIGPFGSTQLLGAYAYHFPVNQRVKASFGVFGGIEQFRFNASRVTLADYDDAAIAASASAFLFPKVTPGFHLEGEKWFAGASIHELLRNRWKVLENNRKGWQYHLLYGQRIKGRKKLDLIASGLFKFGPFATPALDLNLMGEYDKTISVGLSWRNTDAIAAMFKVKFKQYFALGYAFDFTTSRIRYGSSNTHEVILSIYTCAKSKYASFQCPAYF
jgi:type IX secretion system PorP/SprF family membrane protein